MKIVLDTPIYIEELSDEERTFLKENIIHFKNNHIIPQKCVLPEDSIWELLSLIESYGYSVDMRMYNIGCFKLIVE